MLCEACCPLGFFSADPPLLRYLLIVILQAANWVTDEQLVNASIKWNLHVVASVPQDKLLVYNPRKGWGPLCRFLDFYEPFTPFPRCTKMEDYKTPFQLGNFLEKAITITMLVSSVILFFTMPEPFDLFSL